MKAFEAMDSGSLACLDSAAEILCKTQEHRDLLQAVYNLALKDGQIIAMGNYLLTQGNRNEAI